MNICWWFTSPPAGTRTRPVRTRARAFTTGCAIANRAGPRSPSCTGSTRKPAACSSSAKRRRPTARSRNNSRNAASAKNISCSPTGRCRNGIRRQNRAGSRRRKIREPAAARGRRNRGNEIQRRLPNARIRRIAESRISNGGGRAAHRPDASDSRPRGGERIPDSRRHALRRHAGSARVSARGGNFLHPSGHGQAGDVSAPADFVPARWRVLAAETMVQRPSRRRLALRAALIEPEATNAFRVIHGASDGWPGWYVERLGDFLLSQSEAAVARRTARRTGAARKIFSARGAYHKILSRQVRRTTAAEASPQLGPGRSRAGAV